MHKMKYSLPLFVLCAGLVLGCWENRVALFHADDTVPVEVYPLRLEMLPPEDQHRLLAGIRLSDTEELHRLLEDLLS